METGQPPSRESLSSLKVVQLKEKLKEQGLPVSGKKDDLIGRLLEHARTAPQTNAPDEAAVNVLEEVPSGTSGAPVPSDAPSQSDTVPTVASVGGYVDPASQSLPEAAATNGSAGANVGQAPEPPDEVDERAAKRPRLAEPRRPTPPPATPPAAPAAFVADDVPLDVDDDEDGLEASLHAGPSFSQRASDLYLDTVNRDMLDFDFERLCSVTLSNINIYACLVCGKYFQGRGKTSPAYAHSIGEDHHVFINLQSQSVYVLPDGYEVSDPSLDDIKYLLNPTFQPDVLRRLDSGSSGPSYDLQSTPYLPGFIGLNNIKANDYLNVIVHALAHVIPLRDYFVFNSSNGQFERDGRSELVKRFGMLLRKIWNPKAFKAQVSPHEFGQEVSTRSERRFRLTQQADPVEFLGWLLNTLHRDLGGSKRPSSSIIYSAFQGEVRVDDQDVVVKPDSGEAVKPTFDLAREVKTSRHPFLFLTIDLPAPPVFQDAIEKNIIPQVSLSTVLAKYNGITTQELPGKLRRHRCTRLPPFLILHIKRFTSNNFVDEKNPTIVNFPTRGVDATECLEPSPEDLKDNADPITQAYDMVANITYSSAAGSAKEDAEWKVQVHTRPLRDREGNLVRNEAGTLEEEKWFQVQDLIVEEINRQMVFLGESYIQVWERRNTPRELPVFTRKPGAGPPQPRA